MPQTYAGKPSSFYSATGGKPVEGAWYSGQRYSSGQLLAPGEYQQGKKVSNEVVAQTNPNNISYIQDRIRADQVQPPTQISLPSSTAQSDFVSGLTSNVDQAKSALTESITRQKANFDAQLATLKEKEKTTLGQIKPLVSPFRAQLENTERDRLFVNKNFEENQKLVNELDTLLTEGNDLIRQQKEVTGLAAVRNPRIQKSMDDVAARAGVINAVINARNGQIAQAENMIDRTVSAIAGDRKDQISYYETILNLNRQDIVNLDRKSVKLAEEQLAIKKGDLQRAQQTADYIKKLLIDPATAGLMGEGGVKLTDSVQTINKKLTQATYTREIRDMSNKIMAQGAQAVISPKGIPKDELVTLTDSRGKLHYFRAPQGSSEGERTISKMADIISNQSMNFSNAIIQFAKEDRPLSDIYSAYMQSGMGQKYGLPKENYTEIKAIHDVYSGKLSVEEARVKYNIKE